MSSNDISREKAKRSWCLLKEPLRNTQSGRWIYVDNIFRASFIILSSPPLPYSRLSIFYAHTASSPPPFESFEPPPRRKGDRASSSANCSSRRGKVLTVRVSPCRFRILPGALTCIMRYCAVHGMFPTWPRRQSSMLRSTMARSARHGIQESKFYQESTSGLRPCSPPHFVLYNIYVGASCTVHVNVAVAAVHMHYPIIVAMTKVSRANRAARAMARRYAFASGIRARVSSANIITPATL